MILKKVGLDKKKFLNNIQDNNVKNMLKDYIHLILNNQAKIISENQKDLKKAKNYLDKLIELNESNNSGKRPRNG